jgi:putative SOS response-associated peptidase YedK
MCGRYAASKDPDALVEEFEVDEAVVDQALPPDYNVAPTKPVYTVLQRRPRSRDAAPAVSGSTDEPPRRQLRVARWGLVPSWAKDVSIGSRLINARIETLASKPAFRRAYAARRCLLPADGYFEWYQPTGPDVPVTKSGKPRKQPYYLHPGDGSSLAMAGLYEWWRDPAMDRDDPKAWLLSTTVITTTATDAVGHIHDRMPVLVPRSVWSAWLDPDTPGSAELTGLLVPASPDALVTDPVSLAVNDVRNNGPDLVAPIPVE